MINDIIYQTLDRYANVIKSLLQTANSKTVNERLALIATKILLQDHIHTTDEEVAVILDVIQSRLDVIKDDDAAKKASKEAATEDVTTESTEEVADESTEEVADEPVAVPAKKAKTTKTVKK